MYPNFIGIGAPRGGTTWVFKMLQQHSDVSFGFDSRRGVLKEVHFFDNSKQYKHLKVYKNYFKNCNTQIVADITPAYSILPLNRIKLVYSIMPNANIFLCVRNPVDRHWSHISRYNFVRLKRKMEDFPDSYWIEQCHSPGILAFSDYDINYQRWNQYFKESQIHILYFGEMQKTPQNVFNHIFDSLKIKRIVLKDSKKRVNMAKIYPNRFQTILEQIYEPRIKRMKSFFGEDIINKW